MTDLPYWTLYEPDDPEKKWAVRVPTASGRGVEVKFGQRGAEDFTIHKDVARRKHYRDRHAHDRIDDPYAAGFWSWWALWGKKDDLDEAFADAVKRAKKILKQTGVSMPRHNPVREQFNFTHYEEYAAGLSDEALHYAIIDALDTLKAARTWDDDGAGEAKYLDQLSVLRREQRSRGARNNPEWAKKLGRGIYRGARYTAESARDLYHGAREAHASHKSRTRENPSARLPGIGKLTITPDPQGGRDDAVVDVTRAFASEWDHDMLNRAYLTRSVMEAVEEHRDGSNFYAVTLCFQGREFAKAYP